MHIDELSYHIIEFVFTIIELLSFYAFKISNLIFYVNLGRMFIWSYYSIYTFLQINTHIRIMFQTLMLI